MATDTENYEVAQNLIKLRSRRTGQTVAAITRDSGWNWVARTELQEARDRHNDQLLGGEELLAVLEKDCVEAEKLRSAA